MFSFISVNSILHFASKMSDQTLNRPGSSITKSTNSMTFNLSGYFFKHVYFSKICVSFLNSLKNIDHPTSSFSARSALTTTLVLIKFSESQNSINNINLIVHNNNSSSSKTGSSVFQIIKVHDCIITLPLCQHGNR